MKRKRKEFEGTEGKETETKLTRARSTETGVCVVLIATP